jgi:hypothetical protein
MRATLRGIGAVIGPTTVVLALLYYFGWVRTTYQAHQLGLDDTLLGYTTQDYVLRSIAPLEGPLLVTLAAILLALGAHRAIVSWIDEQLRHPEGNQRVVRQVRWFSAGLGVGGVVLVVLGILGAQVVRPSRFVSLWAPIALVVGIALLSYAAHLYNRYVSKGTPGAREVAGINLVAAGVMSALLLLCALRAVSHYAAIRGIELAAQVERVLPSQPDVTVYSVKALALEPSVLETKIGDEASAYRFKYSRLKLLFRADHRFFLRPSDLSDTRNIILADTNDIRLELAPAS